VKVLRNDGNILLGHVMSYGWGLKGLDNGHVIYGSGVQYFGDFSLYFSAGSQNCNIISSFLRVPTGQFVGEIFFTVT
jgi:hypothetical protein